MAGVVSFRSLRCLEGRVRWIQQQRCFGAKGSKGTTGDDDEGGKKKYGKPDHNVAEENLKQRASKKDEDEETLDKTRFDISKRSRPSGDE